MSNRPSATDYDNPPTNCYFVRPILGRAGRPAMMLERYAAVRWRAPLAPNASGQSTRLAPHVQHQTLNTQHPPHPRRVPNRDTARGERSRVRRSRGHIRNGGSAGARTQDQYLKRVLLYQLSYRPVRWRGGRDNTLALARCTHRLLSAGAPRGGRTTGFWLGHGG